MEIDKVKSILSRVNGVPTAELDMNLAEILSCIIDSIQEGGGGGSDASLVLSCDLGNNYNVTLESGSKSELAAIFGITENDVDRILNGEIMAVNVTSRKGGQSQITVAMCTEICIGARANFIGQDTNMSLGYDDGAYYGDCGVMWPK